eukprot:11228285-Lingulodinium_polyedra.AAC.1
MRNAQQAKCNVQQHATACNVHEARRNKQRASRHPQHAACNMRCATANTHPARRDMQNARCIPCNVEHCAAMHAHMTVCTHALAHSYTYPRRRTQTHASMQAGRRAHARASTRMVMMHHAQLTTGNQL